MTLQKRHPSLLVPVVSLCGLFAVSAAHAQVTLTPTVTFANGIYSYDYSVVNNSLNDLFLVSLNAGPGPDAVFNLNAPSGFQATYTDSVLGIVDFSPDLSSASVFGAGTTTSGFTFDSPFKSVDTTFTFVDGVTLPQGGPFGTQGPAVPEPGTLALLVSWGIGSGLLLRRRRAAQN